jgi:transposase InsO family protein
VQDPRTGQLIGTGRKIGRLYELIELHIPHESNICAASTHSSIQLWHHRLAHSSISKLRPLVSQGHLGSVTNESFDCTASQTAKQPTLSFNKSTSILASPFDLVHSDVWGPAPTPTMGGSRYFVIFIDDYSRFTWIYMMKNRHKLPQIYINFSKMIQTQFSKVIKVFRRDNAMEYRDSKLLSFLSEQGTLSEFSCAYTSQQNGRAERKHRHILNSVRAMLISASCPEHA